MSKRTIDQFFKPKTLKTDPVSSDKVLVPLLPRKIEGTTIGSIEEESITLTPDPCCSSSCDQSRNSRPTDSQRTWLKRFNWLAYSKAKDGTYCKFCVLFANEFTGKGQHQKLGALVTMPFRKWKDAIDKFTSHSNSEYHKFSCLAAENFMKVDSRRMEDITVMLDSQKRKEREQNRASLKPIIDTIILCGENEIPLRGHRDSGPLTPEKPLEKEGKFRALLRYRAVTDESFKKHIFNSARNATYISPEIQNEIIVICLKLIQKKVVQSVNSAECFSILGDETLDVSGKEQFSLCIRYILNENKPILKEDFIAFTHITDLSAESIYETILTICASVGLNMDKVIGQGYDGCSTFNGHLSGVHQKFRESHPKAIYVHCVAHRLNLVLSDSLDMPYIRNCLGTINEVANMMRNNTQSGDILKRYIENLVPETQKSRLLRLCDTRFIERQDSVHTFVEVFPAIVATLEELSTSNRAISSSAANLLASIEKGSFLVAMVVCEFIFSITLPLSKYLQKPESDLSSALKFADDTVERLKDLRKPSENGDSSDIRQFHRLFEKAEKMSQDNFRTAIVVPRLVGKQTKRDNPPYSTPEEYYRRSIFIPCVDSLISNLVERFGKNRDILEALDCLLPKNVKETNIHKLKTLKLLYDSQWSDCEVEAEYMLWNSKWRNIQESEIPKKIMSVLDACDKSFYPAIKYLLQVLATLPVSTAELERSFSSLKRIKSYLRNSMNDQRLNGLALLSIHYPAPINSDEVIDEMARYGNRRLVL
ncbi:unnamed protein product [Acanthoscelides obtectus]|uniref:TTF-type domain-containing protein n=1 Tax=Acanthoscelides obtectus TaxID=200917 RepID=A0A9P0KUS9_ACAOB|nr:unnamed protein product [Acanthoscelides obtectus]CAK1632824.1 52 kDa repressor of the inhibitor of the protein kinase [Acanthoscelides obtectus]